MGKWKNVARVVTYPLLHPAETARTTLQIGKTGLVTGAVGYVGWQALTEDKSVARVVSETMIGEEATDSVANTISGAPDAIKGATDKLEQATNAIGNAGQGLSGISNFFGTMMNGGIGNMLSNFMGNLTSGNVSGMGIFGLVGAALLIFGRTGWFGKIAGALLAMMVIGSNGQQQAKGQQQSRTGLPYSRATVYSPENDPNRVFIKAWDNGGRELPSLELTRQQYEERIAQKMTPMQIYHQMTAGGTLEDQARQNGYNR